jgi:hypothetical protein
VENGAPPRVQNTVSPLRVQNTATRQRVAQQTTLSHLTPNSQRRPHTPHRRAATPPTRETKSQSEIQFITGHDRRNNTSIQSLFLFSNDSRQQKSKKIINNEQIIIMPDMANAVICPETGKLLKHQELITKLRYTIKWMRSAANEINRLYNTNTITFIRRSNIPKGCQGTYGSFVVDIKDHKDHKEEKITYEIDGER